MEIDKWIELNHQMLLGVVRNITKRYENDDLFQSVVEQLLKQKEKLDVLPDDKKKFFFIRVTSNNFHSKTSRYHYENRKAFSMSSPLEDETYNLKEDEPGEYPTIEWVHKKLDDMNWFDRDIFLLWMELGSLKAVSKKTKIPHNSVGRYIKKVKIKLNEDWKKQF
jgi:hypothetical protein